ncbi:NAD(P)/FAD-dependent oxidoreductase [Metasolibacillus meyeri]|uniref:Ferredoxin--NADP reductase n=1 Tax=Metasolibacillus meyeri TaxID=1071052 RepID=A0AAW9NNI9_9BACL|nr:NAD(P)/FAD-dependent oxidoreductase [Metasolibacillus meyeri]MEC1179040.1 NAD(P)/FAD-dependent oxidoreductase [Metasolibacillus meyeri]
MELYDVTIIGGGASGLYSAFYSGLRDLKTKVIEYHPYLGGKLNVFLEKILWDVGAQTPIMAEQLLKNLVTQAMTFSPTICLNTKVNFIDKIDEYFVISTEAGEHYSKTVIIAIGGGIVQPIKLEIDGAEKFEMTNLHYTIKHIERFKNKEIIVSGGGNVAIDWAVELLPVAKKITVVYRGDELKAHEAFVNKLKANHIEILVNATIKSLKSNHERTSIEKVIIDQNGVELERDVDDIIICHGYNRDISLDFAESISPERKSGTLFQSIGQCKTTIPGIFAVGDIVAYEDKVNLLVGTFQDAVLAVNSAKKYLQPDANPYAMVSSHNEKFIERNQKVFNGNLVKK